MPPLVDWYILVLFIDKAVWYTASTVNTSVFNALSIGEGLVAAVLLCDKREAIYLDGVGVMRNPLE